MDRDMQMLRAVHLIAEKNWITACANLDTTRYGQWQCDWQKAMIEVDNDLTAVLSQLEVPR